MAKGFVQELTKLLKAAGYEHVGNFKGSHEKWKHGETGLVLQVPFNLKSRHTANSILKDAGMDKKF